MQLSVVTTLYCSERYIEEYYRRVSAAASALTDNYEIVLVDDGSPDSSLSKAVAISDGDEKVRVIELAKNHGHHRAMMIGLAESKGDLVFLIDCDLEEPPESLTLLWKEMHSNVEADLVKGVTHQKEGGVLKQSFSKAFYKMFNYFSPVNIDENELVCRLMKRSYVNVLLQYQESELFLPGVWADAGFVTRTLEIEKRFDGFSTYSLGKKVFMAVTAITAFSNKPLMMIFYLGLSSSFLSIIFVIWLMLKKLFFGVNVDGWTSVMASIYLMGSLVLLSLGVVGIYLSRVFTEVKSRPNSVIRYRYFKGKKNDSQE